MSIDLRTLLRGMGGSACAAGVMLALTSFAGGFASYAPAAAASGDNRGDVWLDTVTQTDQTGHEHDPHLPCNDINLWAASVNDSSGPFTIQGWPPSGAGSSEIDYSATWNYDTSKGGSQIVAVINVQTLTANATASGDTAQPQQGLHFKLDVEDPRSGGSMGDDKYKTFWINCTSSTPTATPGGTPTPTQSTATPTPTESTGTPTPTLSTGSPTSGVGGLTPTPSPGGSPTPAAGVQGLSTTTPSSGVGGLTTPSTGSALPLGISGGLLAIGLVLLGLARRVKRSA